MNEINNKNLKRVCLINDMSCFGKCSLTVSAPIISSFGIEAVPLPTAILSTHTGGFSEFTIFNMSEEMEKISAHWKKCGIKFDAICTGYFCNEKQIEFAKRFIKEFKSEDTLLVVDPVLGDNQKLYVGFDEKMVFAMKELVNLADVITPNFTEAVFLTDSDFSVKAEDIIEKFNNKMSVITSVRNGDKIGYLAKCESKYLKLFSKYYDVPLHGSGDVFVSVLVSNLLCGKNFFESFKSAANFSERAVELTVENTNGGTYGIMFEKVLKERQKDE